MELERQVRRSNQTFILFTYGENGKDERKNLKAIGVIEWVFKRDLIFQWRRFTMTNKGLDTKQGILIYSAISRA